MRKTQIENGKLSKIKKMIIIKDYQLPMEAAND